jgi:fructokinase
VILTNGAQGALGVTAEGASVTCPAAAVEVVDTVGAGDSFLAACLFLLAREGALTSKESLRRIPAGTLERCLVFASRAAGLTCSRPGSDPPFLRELEVDPR